MLVRLSRHVLLLLALSTAAHTAGAPTGNFFVTTRSPAWDFYGYLGTNWFDVLGQASDTLVVPVEFRTISPGDFELGVDSSLIAPEGRLGDADFGDTTLRLAKSFRPAAGIDYLTLELGYVASRGPDGFSGGIDWSGGVRAQGGATRLGYDVSVTYLDLDEESGFGDEGVTTSVGYRGQFGRLHLGLDYIATRFEDDTQRSVDLVVMQRSYTGGAIYGLLQKGLSEDNDFWYVGFGYEHKFGF